MSARASATRLAFYATPPHPCGYLADRRATTLFADPRHPKNKELYTLLSHHGFRRSGPHLYRPHCGACQACVPVRVPVAEFQPRRRQRRTWRANRDLRVTRGKMQFRREHFELYRRYLDSRHKGGGMDDPTPEQYLEFLSSPWADTLAYEFRSDAGLVAVAVADVLVNALSAVYTFFDPEQAARSPGVYAILWQIEDARRMGLDWLYLGYWIEQSDKMRYKREYQPQEHLVGGAWVRDGDATQGERHNEGRTGGFAPRKSVKTSFTRSKIG